MKNWHNPTPSFVKIKEDSEINTHKESENFNDDIKLPSPDIERRLSQPVQFVDIFLKKRIESEYTEYF
jgi:hypothetical protein